MMVATERTISNHKEISLVPHHRVQTGSGSLPVSYPMCSEGSFLGDEATGS